MIASKELALAKVNELALAKVNANVCLHKDKQEQRQLRLGLGQSTSQKTQQISTPIPQLISTPPSLVTVANTATIAGKASPLTSASASSPCMTTGTIAARASAPVSDISHSSNHKINRSKPPILKKSAIDALIKNYQTVPTTAAVLVTNNVTSTNAGLPLQRKLYNKRKAGRHSTKYFNTNAFQPTVPQSRHHNHSIPILPSAPQISASIPKNASSIFHIWDRRIDFDSFGEDASLYSRLRSWVQDDPYRRGPNRGIGGDLVDRMRMHEQSNCNDQNEKSVLSTTEPCTTDEGEHDRDQDEIQSQTNKQTCNILDNTSIGTSTFPQMTGYLKEYVRKGSKKRTRRNRILQQQDAICLKLMKEREGISMKNHAGKWCLRKL